MKAAVLLSLLLPVAAAAQPAVTTESRVEKFSLPFFDNQGKRTALLRGEAAKSLTATEFTIEGLHFSHFVPAGETRPETVLLSPLANVVIRQRTPVISGPDFVRLVRSDIEASGEDWTYDHAAKKLTLRRNVKVVYAAELKGFLP